MRRRLFHDLIDGKPVSIHGCELQATSASTGRLDGVRCLTCGTQRSGCVLDRRGWLARSLARHLHQALADPACTDALAVQLLWQLATNPEPSVRTDVARHPLCPEATMDFLGRDWWWEVRAAVASHPRCPVDCAHRLALDETTWVRRALAENPDIQLAVLAVLARDSDFGVRDAVAEHPRCPGELLAVLGGDATWEIRRSVAKRRDAPPAVLAQLAGDPEHWVRFFVACNPATPADIRSALQADPRPSVRGLARRSRRRSRSVAMYLAVDSRPAEYTPQGYMIGTGRKELDMPEIKTFAVEGMTCGHCTKAVHDELVSVPGVSSVDADLDTKIVTVTGNGLDEQALRSAIVEAGYEAS